MTPQKQARTALVLGVIAFFGIPFTLGLSSLVAPFAWGLGSAAIKDSDTRSQPARDAVVLGVAGTTVLVLAVVTLMLIALRILLDA